MKKTFVIGTLMLISTVSDARDLEQRNKFRSQNPCPSTGKIIGPNGHCPGYVVDHKWPLCAGGKDLPENMQWEEYKASLVKDDLERAYCNCMKGKK